MKRLKLLVLLVSFGYCSFGIPSTLAETENHITHGPILGRLSPNSIRIWARTARTVLAIIGKRIFLDFRRPATGHANLVSGVGSAEMDRSSG